jgi:hypothetical protein
MLLHNAVNWAFGVSTKFILHIFIVGTDCHLSDKNLFTNDVTVLAKCSQLKIKLLGHFLDILSDTPQIPS